MHRDHSPVVKAEMLIRRPASEVFRAFTDPEITSRFWFTHSSGPLLAGARVRWEWRMYGASTEVRVLALEPNQRILIEWDDPPTRVEWVFTARPDETTHVTITHSGFSGETAEIIQQALDSMGGFSFVLAAVKALLEHNLELNLVADHHPDAHLAREGPVAG